MSEAAAAGAVAAVPSRGRARARGRSLVRVFAFALGGAALVLLGVYAMSERALERRYPIDAEAAALAAVPIDGALLERGRHLVTEVAQCSFCHGPDLAGRVLADDPWIGRLHASNLTRGEGGAGARLTDAQWVAALRHGVASDGRSLLLMPSAGLARLSERDLAAVVAYVRQVPAVDRVLPERRAGWLTRAVLAAGLAPDLISAEQVATVARAERGGQTAAAERAATPSGTIEAQPTPAYGAYLVSIGGCRVCHRADLGGGMHPLSLPGEPVPPDLTRRGRLAEWTLRDFARAMREGRTPDGRVLDREFMPWPAFSGLDDLEVEALWRYLETVEVPAI